MRHGSSTSGSRLLRRKKSASYWASYHLAEVAAVVFADLDFAKMAGWVVLHGLRGAFGVPRGLAVFEPLGVFRGRPAHTTATAVRSTDFESARIQARLL
jgi:hypothetical protein